MAVVLAGLYGEYDFRERNGEFKKSTFPYSVARFKGLRELCDGGVIQVRSYTDVREIAVNCGGIIRI